MHHVILGLKPKLKQVLPLRQPQTWDDTINFAKRKHHFTDCTSETELIELLQDIPRKISLKHTDIKRDAHNDQLNISQLQTEAFKRNIYNTAKSIRRTVGQQLPSSSSSLRREQKSSNCSKQNATVTNLITLELAVTSRSRMAKLFVVTGIEFGISHVFPMPSNTWVVIRTKDLVMQAMKHRNIRSDSQRVTTLMILGDTTNHRTTFIPDSHGNPPLPPPKFGNQPNDKYQGKTFNIPGQYSRNYSNVIENHALQEHSHRIK